MHFEVVAQIPSRREMDGAADGASRIQRFLDGRGIGYLLVASGAEVQNVEDGRTPDGGRLVQLPT